MNNSIIESILALPVVKQFFRVRDDEGNLDWKQVTASAIQITMLLVAAYLLISWSMSGEG